MHFNWPEVNCVWPQDSLVSSSSSAIEGMVFSIRSKNCTKEGDGSPDVKVGFALRALRRSIASEKSFRLRWSAKMISI